MTLPYVTSRATRRNCFSLLLLLALSVPASAQVATGTPTFGSFAGGPDIMDLANLNAHITIPVLHKPGRGGMNFAYDLNYDSTVWGPVGASGSQSWIPASNWGWQVLGQYAGVLSNSVQGSVCTINGHNYHGVTIYYNWHYWDRFGINHLFPNAQTYMYTSPCGSGTTSDQQNASDGSGFQLNAQGRSGYVLSSAGANLASALATDRNGNQISVNSVTGAFTDTLGKTVLTMSGNAPSPVTFTYTAPSGGNAVITVQYQSYAVQTNFHCSGITEYGTNGTTTANLISEIDLPEYNSTTNPSARYLLAYEATPGKSGFYTGRIASITLPTGGTISYAYSGGGSGVNGISCADGSAATLVRTTPDGVWTYAQTKGTGAASTTTFTDPANNQTAIQFQGIYETERQMYQGSTSGTLEQTIWTCYNGSTTPCNSAGVSLPINQRTVTQQYGTSGLEYRQNYFYSSNGGLTEEDDYDYGSGAPGSLLRKLLISYSPLSNNITSFRQTVTVCNGSGSSPSCNNVGSVVSQTTYNYDEPGTLTTTSGIAQHTSVTGSRGNLTSINYPVSGLTSHFTYYDTGSPNTSQDVNGATTTYSYDPNHITDCQNAFPIGMTEPAVAIGTMTRSLAWNCTGGLLTQLTDENNQIVQTSYSDPYYWRPASVTDQSGFVTNFCYAALLSGSCPSTPSSTQFESYLNFNSGNSTMDSLTTLDGLGRVHVQQTRQGPAASNSNFDSVETDYDSFGRPTRLTVPYVGTAGQTCPIGPSCPATTTTYDPLSRVSQTKDGGGGTVSFSYSPNSSDVIVGLGPAPSGESIKQRQLEYDGFGRLTSVCEMTVSLPGYGTCSQQSSKSGYWTKYTYDVLGDLLTVTQNAQASSGSQQNRSYSFDAMGRLTSETNPEAGTTSYVYDSIASGSCTGTYQGDLVKRIDAIGNITCFTYDKLHRTLSKTYGVISPTVGTPNKCFVYDAVIDGRTASYTKTRLAEAYTTTSACSQTTLPPVATDEAFSFSQRGEPTAFYELTPHSSPTYYQVSQTYWPNYAPNVLSGNIGLPSSITYGVEGEGRISAVSASSGQNPVTSTTYNIYALPNKLTVNFGSGDSDVFSYDPNTMRMSKYQFNVGLSTVTGTLGWNSNGSLGSLNINDPFSTANSQNCAFVADDLARISQSNCGAVWGQNFSYDAFGNIQKNVIPNDGGTSFAPCYQTSPSITNRIALVGGTGSNCSGGTAPQYDANGNFLNDTFRSYTWDAENRPATINSITFTNDALGRVVEQGTSGNYSEIVYGPAGAKLALMNGTALNKAFVSLPGGAIAVYTSSSGLAYYRHTDHLTSSRFASTTSQTLYADYAYSPFGEPYAQSGAIDPSFTGQNQDAIAGLYDFMYREHDPNQARWTQPDPSGLRSASYANPQSWNRYAYVLNHPLSVLDPNGLNPVPFVMSPCGDNGCGGCAMDGIATSCDLASASVGSGAAVACPNGVCMGIDPSNGSIVYFKAFADGSSGYLPFDSPAGYSAADIANATDTVHKYANGTAIDPSQLTGQALKVYNLLIDLGVDPDNITIYQTGTQSFSAVLTDEGFDQLQSSDLIDSNAGDAFLHYPYTDGARSDQTNLSLHFVWFDESLTDYVGGTGVYMEFHADSSNPWNGGFWQHWGCDVFRLSCHH